MVFHNKDILPFKVLDNRRGLIGSHLLIATGVPVPELLTFFKEVHCHRLTSTRRQSNAGTAAQLDAHVYKLAQKYRELLLGQVSKYPILYLR